MITNLLIIILAIIIIPYVAFLIGKYTMLGIISAKKHINKQK